MVSLEYTASNNEYLKIFPNQIYLDIPHHSFTPTKQTWSKKYFVMNKCSSKICNMVYTFFIVGGLIFPLGINAYNKLQLWSKFIFYTIKKITIFKWTVRCKNST